MSEMNDSMLLQYISDPKEIERFRAVIKDMSDTKSKIDAYNDYLKEAKKALKEDFELPVSVINTVFKLYHEQKAREYFQTQEEIGFLYEKVFGEVE